MTLQNCKIVTQVVIYFIKFVIILSQFSNLYEANYQLIYLQNSDMLNKVLIPPQKKKIRNS